MPESDQPHNQARYVASQVPVSIAQTQAPAPSANPFYSSSPSSPSSNPDTAKQANRISQTQALIQADALQSAKQARMEVSGQGKSDEQYKQDVINAHVQALQQANVPLTKKTLAPLTKYGIDYDTLQTQQALQQYHQASSDYSSIFNPALAPPEKPVGSDIFHPDEAASNIFGDIGAGGKAYKLNLFENVNIKGQDPFQKNADKTGLGGYSELFAPSSGKGPADLNGIDTDTVNKVNSFVSDASNKKGVDTITIDIGGQKKSYPISQALSGIFSDVQNQRSLNPNAPSIPFSLGAVGSVTTTVKPNSQQAAKDRSDLLGFIQKSGGNPIIIKDANGNKIAETSGQRARFDIMKASENGPVNLEYTKTTSKISPTWTITQNGKPYNEKFPASEVSPLGQYLKGAYSQQQNIFGPPSSQEKTPVSTFFGAFTGAGSALLQGKNPIPVFQQGLEETGKAVQQDPAKAAGSITEELGFNLATLGTGEAVRGGSILARAVSKEASTTKNLITSGLREKALPYGFEETPTTLKFSQGTEGRTVKPSNSLVNNIFGIGKAGEAQSLKLTANGLRQAGSDIGIGGFSKASPKFNLQETIIPNEVKIPELFTNKESPLGAGLAKTGEAENPLAFFGKNEGSGAFIVKKGTQDIFPPNAALIKGEAPNLLKQGFQKIPSNTDLYYNTLTGETKLLEAGSKKAQSLLKQGFERRPAGVDMFFGVLGPESRLFLRNEVGANRLRPSTDIFGFSSEQFYKRPYIYSKFTREPENLYKTSSDVERPYVVRFFETTNEGYGLPTSRASARNTGSKGKASIFDNPLETGSKGLNRKLNELGKRETTYINPITGLKERISSDFNPGLGKVEKPVKTIKSFPEESFPASERERYPLFGTGTKEPATITKPKGLTEENKSVLSNLFLGQKKKIKASTQPYDYLGPVYTPEQRQARGKRNQVYETGYETIAYPKQTSENIFGPSLKITPQSRTKQRGEQILKPEFNLDILPNIKTERETKNRLQTDVITGLFSGQKENQITRPIQRQTPFTIQTNRQTTTEIQTPKLGLETPQRTLTETPSIFKEDFNIPNKPNPIFAIPPFGGGFLPGGRFGGEGRLPPGKRKYILWGTNPNEVGEFYTKGLKEQTVSSSPSIFEAGNKIIARANRGKEVSSLVSFSGNVNVVTPKKTKSLFAGATKRNTRRNGKSNSIW